MSWFPLNKTSNGSNLESEKTQSSSSSSTQQQQLHQNQQQQQQQQQRQQQYCTKVPGSFGGGITGGGMQNHQFSPFGNMIVGMAICSLLGTLCSIFGPTLYLIEKLDAEHAHNQHSLLPPRETSNRIMTSSSNNNNNNTSNNGFVEVVDLEHEHLFRATIKSCVPDVNDAVDAKPKCKTFMFEPNDPKLIEYRKSHPINLFASSASSSADYKNEFENKQKQQDQLQQQLQQQQQQQQVQRIAIITPPGATSTSLLNRAEQIAYLHNRNHRLRNRRKIRDGTVANADAKKDEVDTDAPIELIPRSHVPPYGYGKTHGLTKIVRLVPHPLAFAVTDALLALLEPGETYRDAITLDDVKAALRQILRYHCRLSHVAAHTAILSISFMELMEDARSVAERMEAFFTPKDTAARRERAVAPPDGVKEEEEDPELEEEEGEVYEYTADDDQEELFDSEARYASELLTLLQSAVSAAAAAKGDGSAAIDVHTIMDQVLLREIQFTKNMTVWPCPSFWSVGEETNPNKLSPIVQRLAKKLSPDCDNDPLANCWVERDKCEARGDATCAKQTK